MLKTIFLWWEGATLGTVWTIWRSARLIGTDSLGNRYYEARSTKGSYDGRKRRFVKYKGYADASKIPPDWHGWMHYIYDTPPSKEALPTKAWQLPHRPNLSGTPFALFPPGSMNAKGQRARSSSDYDAWKP